MKKKLPIGVSDFRTVITDNGYYVDKTLLIAEWLQTISGNVTLITRPRRFGKTLNMTMLREFFDVTEDSQALFAHLAISRTPYIRSLNQYPVIYLSFKDCKDGKRRSILCIMDILLQALSMLPSDLVPDKVDAIRLAQVEKVLADQDLEKLDHLERSIFLLSKLLYQYYGKKVIILIDEYDTPMIAAYEGGYYEDVRPFFKSLYGSALKDNPYLERAMLTGIHRIAKENIFSGLNNLEVCTVMDKEYRQYFGLTPEETGSLLAHYDLTLDRSVQMMYDGYRFGGQEIYNPWSVLNYADKKALVPYWINTASNRLLLQAMNEAGAVIWQDLETLLAQGRVSVLVDLQTSFFELAQPATLWGLFLSSGYLTITEDSVLTERWQTLRIPDQEVMVAFESIVEHYGGFADNSLSRLFDALLRKDMPRFREAYEQIILTCTSFHDGAVENAYHMLFLGMCVYLSSTHDVSSNIERGHGRADIVLAAKRHDAPNFVIEFKQGEAINKLAQDALTQIHEKSYLAGLTGETVLLGIAHDLKHCQIVTETLML